LLSSTRIILGGLIFNQQPLLFFLSSELLITSDRQEVADGIKELYKSMSSSLGAGGFAQL
jgi:hypothetical protein